MAAAQTADTAARARDGAAQQAVTTAQSDLVGDTARKTTMANEENKDQAKITDLFKQISALNFQGEDTTQAKAQLQTAQKSATDAAAFLASYTNTVTNDQNGLTAAQNQATAAHTTATQADTDLQAATAKAKDLHTQLTNATNG